MVLKLALKELSSSVRRLGLPVFILSVGFIGPFFSSAVRSSVDEYLANSARDFLSADVSVNALRPLKDEEVEFVRDALKPMKLARETEFVTMARGEKTSALVEVKGVDSVYPVFGEFHLRRSQDADDIEAVSDASSLNGEEHVVWAFPEALTQLGLKIGSSVGIGETQFRVVAVVEKAPGMSRTVGVAPRLYIGRRHVEATGLTLFGAQVHHRVFVALSGRMSGKDISEKLKPLTTDSDLFVRTPDDAIRGFERFFRFFNIYLVALTMVVFLLSWVSAFYVLQLFLQERLKNAAILMINGAGRVFVGALMSLQVFFVLAMAFVVAGVVVAGAIALTNLSLGTLLPEGFSLSFKAVDLGILLLVAAVSALAFNGPFYMRLYFMKLNQLLGETSMGDVRFSRSLAMAGYGPLAFVFLGLAVWLMDSLADALRVAGGMTVATLIGWGAGRLLFRLFFTALRERPGSWRLVATSLARSRLGVSLCFLTLVLVALSLNLVPHLLKTAVSEIQPLQGREVPALFLFNIPESGLPDLRTFAIENDVELRYLSPMVLGRLSKVNGEKPEDDRLRRFPVRLSYREARIASETLVEGRDFRGHFDPNSATHAEVSIEKRFAERNGLKIGDELEFDIQGLPVLARVTSIRQVRWTSFNPNFFIMFQPGVLDDAPKSWIANVNMDGDLQKRAAIQFELSRRFPDISVIDIGRTVNQVLEIARDLIWPVKGGAWIAMFMSLLILSGVVHHNLQLREREIDIEKLLGADGRLIRKLLVGEYAAMSFFAWLVGAGGSVAIAWVVSESMFEIPFRLDLGAFVLSGGATVGIAVLISRLAASRVLAMRSTNVKL